MTGDKTKEHLFKNTAETPSGPVDKLKLIDHNSLKTSIKFIFITLRYGKELFM